MQRLWILRLKKTKKWTHNSAEGQFSLNIVKSLCIKWEFEKKSCEYFSRIFFWQFHQPQTAFVVYKFSKRKIFINFLKTDYFIRKNLVIFKCLFLHSMAKLPMEFLQCSFKFFRKQRTAKYVWNSSRISSNHPVQIVVIFAYHHPADSFPATPGLLHDRSPRLQPPPARPPLHTRERNTQHTHALFVLYVSSLMSAAFESPRDLLIISFIVLWTLN